MKSVCCLALFICHIELEFQKSTAVNLRNPLRSLWLSIGRAQPIGAWRQRKCRCGKSLYSSLFIIIVYCYLELWSVLVAGMACRYARRDFCSTLDRMLSSSNRFSPLQGDYRK